MLLKVKSERGKNHAIELIRELMQSLGIERFEREWEDFHLPYEENDALIERGLIKVLEYESIRNPYSAYAKDRDTSEIILSPAQTVAYEKIESLYEENAAK